jgi:prevent-host-death family protein
MSHMATRGHQGGKMAAPPWLAKVPSKVAVRDLRNDTRAVLDRVTAGETLTLTVRGRSMATIAPLRLDRRWVPRAEFVRKILALEPDEALEADARAVSPETTDELE